MTKLRKFFEKVFFNSWVVGLLSLVWFLFRTGLKPTRAIYPCQQLARINIAVFGLPALLFFWGRFKKCPKFRKKVFFSAFFVLLFLISFLELSHYLKNKRLDSLGLVGEISGAGLPSRVVWITDDRAGTSYGQAWESKANQAIVDNMLDEAVKGLTDRSTVADAWTKVFSDHNGGRDYAAEEKIAIKVNFNNSYSGDQGCNEGGCPTVQVVRALLRQLVNNKGISQGNITVYDTSRTFPPYYINGIRAFFPNVRLNPDADVWPVCTVADSVNGARFGCAVAGANYLINMPLLRTHSMAGVTLSFKNHLGSTNTSSAFHGAFFNLTSDANSLIQLNSHPLIKNKTILIVDDAIFGLKSGGPGGMPNIAPNSIFVSSDPVAVDSVMIDYLDSLSAYYTGKDPRVAYRLAGQIGLGNFATSCSGSSCSFSYSNIDLQRCNRVCGASVPTSTPTRVPPTLTPTLIPCPLKGRGDATCDGIIDILDFEIWRREFLGIDTTTKADFDSVGGVSILDFEIWRRGFLGQ